MSRQVLW